MNHYHYIDHYEPIKFPNQKFDKGYALTNFDPSELPTYEKALEVCGRDDIWIEKESYPGTPSGCYSLWAKTECDCSDFWEEFYKLKK